MLRRYLPLLALLAGLAWLGTAVAADDDKDFKPLFNGKDFTGWKVVIGGKEAPPGETFASTRAKEICPRVAASSGKVAPRSVTFPVTVRAGRSRSRTPAALSDSPFINVPLMHGTFGGALPAPHSAGLAANPTSYVPGISVTA